MEVLRKVTQASEIFKNISEKDNIVFDICIFLEDIDISYRKSEVPLKFKNCYFKGSFTAIYATFNEVVEFEHCEFKKEVNFGDCEQAHTIFEKSINLKNCIFKNKFDFVGVIVKGMADFYGSTFEQEVNFLCSKFERALFICDAKFHNKANFKSMEVASYVRFDNTEFSCPKSKIDFTGSLLGNKATFKEINCQSILTIIAVKSDFLNFEKAILNNKLEACNINCSEFLCQKVKFLGEVDFNSTHIKLTLNLDDSEIHNEFSLKSVVVHQVHFKVEMKPGGELDLRGFKFEVIPNSDTKDDMDKLLEIFNDKQINKKFSRDPYIELECFYRSRGRMEFADEVHYIGRSQLRKKAKDEKSGVNMGWIEKILDGIAKYLTGYGTRNGILLLIIFIIIAIGIAIFYNYNVSHDAPYKAPEKLIYYFVYTVDMFIPLADFDIYDEKDFSTPCLPIKLIRSLYMILGWILVPLALASITGVLSKKEK